MLCRKSLLSFRERWIVLSQTRALTHAHTTHFVSKVLPIINQLLQFGRVNRAVVGLDIILLDSLTAEKEKDTTGVDLLPTKKEGGGRPPYACGLLVSRVLPGKPGDSGGFREGDVILEINGKRQVRKGSFFQALGPVHVPGKTLDCLVWRPKGPRLGGSFMKLVLKPIPRTLR